MAETVPTAKALPTRRAAGGPAASGHVTICAPDGRPWGRGRFEPRTEVGRTTGELVAPLWMVSLGGDVRIRFEDGREGRLRVRQITAMDGPVATVRVELVA